jgi:membrane-associated phospholipid phosphatase
LTGLFGRIDALWGRAWPLPLIPAMYLALVAALGDARPEHFAFAVGCPALAYYGPRSKQFLIDVSPYVLVGLGYDAVRYLLKATLTPERVITCGLRDLERWMWSTDSGATLQDLSQAHPVPALDLLFAFPYAAFVYIALLYAVYLFWADRPRMRWFLWSFAIANYVSFALWVLVPAAAPWYVRAHGCVVDLSVSANPAGLARVDEMLGIDYFRAFYSRASQVFGALPSMHCAYPMLGLITAWRAAGWATRPLHVAYVLLMFGASVYLDHHWLIDGFAGWAVAALSCYAAARILKREGDVTRRRRRERPDAAPRAPSRRGA